MGKVRGEAKLEENVITLVSIMAACSSRKDIRVGAVLRAFDITDVRPAFVIDSRNSTGTCN